MKYFETSASIVAVLFLSACGGGGGGSTPLELTVASFTEFKLTENSLGSWPIEASVNKSASPISHSISGGPDSGDFALSGNTLSFTGSANYEAASDLNTDGVYEIYVTTSSGTASSTQTIYVRVIDVAEAPTILTTAISNTSENSSAVSTISASDDDRNSVLSYSLVDSGGSKDEGLLSIDSATGAVNFIAAPNFESPSDLNADNTVDFTVMVSDGVLSDQSDFTFSITNVNETPSISSASFSIPEQSLAVGSISASDPDASTTLTYSLASGSAVIDDAKFSINSSTGAISFLVLPNFEGPTDNGLDNVYNFTVNVSDGSLSTSQAMTVTIEDVNEGPAFSPSFTSAQTYTENSIISISVAATDQDASSVLTYSLSGTDASKFTISSAGALSFASGPDYESPADNGGNNVYNVWVDVSDGSISSSVALVITVSDDTADNFGIKLPGKVAVAELKKES